MPKPKIGDTVVVAYTGTLADGKIFDSSEGSEPLEFEIGQEQVIPLFEQKITELEGGEKAHFTIPAAEAYGERSEENTFPVPRSEFPLDVVPEVGMMLELAFSEDEAQLAVVSKIDGDTVFLDLNHPLAGYDLTFDVELLNIK